MASAQDREPMTPANPRNLSSRARTSAHNARGVRPAYPSGGLAPALSDLTGVGPDVAGALLVTAGDNPDRLRSDPAMPACAALPCPCVVRKDQPIPFEPRRGRPTMSTPRKHRSPSKDRYAATHPAVTVHFDLDTHARLVAVHKASGLSLNQVIRAALDSLEADVAAVTEHGRRQGLAEGRKLGEAEGGSSATTKDGRRGTSRPRQIFG